MSFRDDIFFIADITNPESRISETLRFQTPEAIIEAKTPDDIELCLGEMSRLENEGYYLAGFFTYEAFLNFNNDDLIPRDFQSLNYPLLWFGAFRKYEKIDLKSSSFGYYASPLEPSLDYVRYYEKFNKIKSLIEKGINYQINLTFPFHFDFFGDPMDLFLQLKENQKSLYNFFVKLPNIAFLSLSPEIFYYRNDQDIMARPMKGTLKKTANPSEDKLNLEGFIKSEKNRAENAMIADIFRNDFGKICQNGSIEVEGFYNIEEYPTLYQATTTIKGKLKKDAGTAEILKALSPSASITGAPKNEAIKHIRKIESYSRGVYTGSFGIIYPKKKSVFNIAIRTLEIKGSQGRAGFGSGIVYDSDPEDEYRESLLKSAFIHSDKNPFFLFETILYKRNKFYLLNYHLDRICRSAQYFRIKADPGKFVLKLEEAVKNEEGTYRVKLILFSDGSVKAVKSPFKKDHKTYKADLMGRPFMDKDFLVHKTSRRNFYDNAISSAKGFDEVIFINEKNEVTEGAYHNIIIKQKEKWITPYVQSGILPGTLRRYLLEKKIIEEKIIHVRDLLDCQKIALVNSLRGIHKVEINREKIKSFIP